VSVVAEGVVRSFVAPSSSPFPLFSSSSSPPLAFTQKCSESAEERNEQSVVLSREGTTMTACAKSRDFFLHGDAAAFDAVLALYDKALRLKAENKSSKPDNVIKLDKW